VIVKQRGINRVVMAVSDLEKGKAFYAKLLGATFHPVHDEDAAAYGIECEIAWDAGIELVAPMPERLSHVRTHIEKHGEGLMGTVFAVEDVDACRAAAETLGVRIVGELDYEQETIDRWLQGRFEKYKEYFLAADGPLSAGLLIGEFIDSPAGAKD
jgi:catechol 2,3-dioxygenase-like lactoylglutathione lyase family enzyme